LPSTIEHVHREFGARGLTLLAVNIKEERDQVARWVKEKGVTVPVLLDPDGTVTAAYAVRGTPTVVLVGRDGQWVGRGVGSRGWMTEAGRTLLKAFLDQPVK
jgi:peroxiredoxin